MAVGMTVQAWSRPNLERGNMSTGAQCFGIGLAGVVSISQLEEAVAE